MRAQAAQKGANSETFASACISGEKIWTDLAEKWQVKKNCQRRGISGEDDELGDTTVEGLGGLVGALLELVVVAGLVQY